MRIFELAITAASLAIATPVSNPIARRGNLPTPIAVSTAKSYLSELTVADEINSPPYDRDAFNHWITISGSCDTREYVLRRDGTSVKTGSDCYPESGSWYSDYDGETWTEPGDVDIDHVVPLREAWVSGAWSWTDSEREDFANEYDTIAPTFTHSNRLTLPSIVRPQLLAVTDNINQSKGDDDLAEWLPPRTAYQCEYVRAFIQVKHYYGLTMDSAEKEAASDVLYNVC